MQKGGKKANNSRSLATTRDLLTKRMSNKSSVSSVTLCHMTVVRLKATGSQRIIPKIEKFNAHYISNLESFGICFIIALVQQNSQTVEFCWENIEGNLRRANTERSMEFRRANTEPS